MRMESLFFTLKEGGNEKTDRVCNGGRSQANETVYSVCDHCVVYSCILM